jgi:hypothetical protein
VRTGSVKLGKKCVVNRAVSWLVVYNTVQGRRYSRGWRRRRNSVMSWLVVQEIQG